MVRVSHPVASLSDWRLNAEAVTVRRRRREVVRDFTWSHTPGHIAWMTGENGAGKSSLLQVLAGRKRPAHGSLHLTGAEQGRATSLYYHPRMRLPGRARVGEWRRLIEKLLEASESAHEPLPAGLDTIVPDLEAERRLDQLSTGEEKRLLLDAILRRPAPYLFLDEPYEHLSVSAKETLTAILLARAAHSVVVVATNQTLPPHAVGPKIRLDGVGAIIEPLTGEAP